MNFTTALCLMATCLLPLTHHAYCAEENKKQLTELIAQVKNENKENQQNNTELKTESLKQLLTYLADENTDITQEQEETLQDLRLTLLQVKTNPNLIKSPLEQLVDLYPEKEGFQFKKEEGFENIENESEQVDDSKEEEEIQSFNQIEDKFKNIEDKSEQVDDFQLEEEEEEGVQFNQSDLKLNEQKNNSHLFNQNLFPLGKKGRLKNCLTKLFTKTLIKQPELPKETDDVISAEQLFFLIYQIAVNPEELDLSAMKWIKNNIQTLKEFISPTSEKWEYFQVLFSDKTPQLFKEFFHDAYTSKGYKAIQIKEYEVIYDAEFFPLYHLFSLNGLSTTQNSPNNITKKSLKKLQDFKVPKTQTKKDNFYKKLFKKLQSLDNLGIFEVNYTNNLLFLHKDDMLGYQKKMKKDNENSTLGSEDEITKLTGLEFKPYKPFEDFEIREKKLFSNFPLEDFSDKNKDTNESTSQQKQKSSLLGKIIEHPFISLICAGTGLTTAYILYRWSHQKAAPSTSLQIKDVLKPLPFKDTTQWFSNQRQKATDLTS